MNQTRPKNLNILTIRFPLPAIASILHRISGFILFIMIPLLLWLLQYSLTGYGYADIQSWMESFWLKFIIWALMAPLCYHLIAGIRHLLSDLHIGNTRQSARYAVLAVFALTALLLILVGCWIW